MADENDKQTAVKALDAMIADLTRELQLAQQAAQRLAMLVANLNALQMARNLLVHGTQATIPIPAGGATVIAGSVGFIALEILRDAGRPITVGELQALVRNKRPDLNLQTLSGVLSQYVARGLIHRPNPAQYMLAPAGLKALAGAG
jgi:hypothetical protein